MEKSFSQSVGVKLQRRDLWGVGGGWGGGGVVCRKGCSSEAIEPIADIDFIPLYPQTQPYMIIKFSKE